MSDFITECDNAVVALNAVVDSGRYSISAGRLVADVAKAAGWE